jgi:serine/threonine/tyrosine-interacting protein
MAGTFRSVQVIRDTPLTKYHPYVMGLLISRPTTTRLITCLTRSVCIRDAKEAFSVRPRFQDDFQYMTLDVEDNEEQNLIRLFPQ